jgi:hypothetical protein
MVSGNHADAIAAIELCVVPTVTFDHLYALLVVGHGRRQLRRFNVSRHPTAEWLAGQMTEPIRRSAIPFCHGDAGLAAPTRLRNETSRGTGMISPRPIFRSEYMEDRRAVSWVQLSGGKAKRLSE